MKRVLICCDGTWNRPDRVHDGQVCSSNVTKISRCILPEDPKGTRIDERRKPFRPAIWKQRPKADGQVLDVHSNVCGSYPQSGLSDIAMPWMVAKAEACGLAIDRNRMTTVNDPQPDVSGKLYDSQTLWYRLAGLGDYIRPMGRESAAITVIDRAAVAANHYEPPNLRTFLAHGGAVTKVPLS